MYRPWVALAAATCCFLFGACRGKQDNVPDPSQSSQTAETTRQAASTATFRFRIHPTLPEYSFTLLGDQYSDNSDTLLLKRIEIRRGAETEPFQVLEGLNTATPLQPVPPLSVVDMNFDGYRDIRLIDPAIRMARKNLIRPPDLQFLRLPCTKCKRCTAVLRQEALEKLNAMN